MSLRSRFFFPPVALFPVMWVVLYVLIGMASYRIWMLRREGGNAIKALTFYCVQLMLNFAWPFVFFHFQLYGLAFFSTFDTISIFNIHRNKFYQIR